MIYIDPRAGSNKLFSYFEGECEEMILEGGDVAFFGNGPENTQWFIGIEYKNIADIVGCMKSGRFTGTQLPAMMKLYDVCFLLIEGIGVMNPHNGMLSQRNGQMSIPMGLHYSGWDNFQTSIAVHSALAGQPCIIKRSANIRESVQVIKDIYSWFQKPWEEHTSISRPDRTKMANMRYELEVIEVDCNDPEYPKYWLRRALFQLDRMGWAAAGALADKYETIERLLAASQKEIEDTDKVGKTMAARIYQSLHGHPDPTVKVRKKKSQVTEQLDLIPGN